MARISCPKSQDVPYAHRQVQFFTDDDGQRLISDSSSVVISPRSQNFRPFFHRSSSILSVDTAFSGSNAIEDNMEDDKTLNDATSSYAITSSSPLFSPQLCRSPTIMSVNSTISMRSVLEPGQVLPLTLDELCQTIDRHHSLQKARILSTYKYVQSNARMAPHRCIVMHIQRDGRKPIWLRLDRRPTSRVDLIAKFGTTRANDQVWADHVFNISVELMALPGSSRR